MSRTCTVILRSTIGGISLLLFACAATSGDQVSASYQSANPDTIAGTGTRRLAPRIIQASPAEFEQKLQERLHNGYRVLGRSEFTSNSAAPLLNEAVAQGMKVNASIVIYSVQSGSHGGGANQHRIAFVKLAAWPFGH